MKRSAAEPPPISSVKFKILRPLGEGGMGKVYLAEWEGRQVALKFLDPKLGKDYLEFFRGEVRILSRLNHPNLIKIYDFFSQTAALSKAPALKSLDLKKYSRTPCYVMEYLEGVCLDRLSQNLPFSQILSLFSQSCQALHHLHTRNILHRDLKPSNIIVGNQAQLKILDFGLAHSADVRSSGPLMGTVAYMAPETYRAEYGVASDLFALGVVFYQWLTGSLPYLKPLRDLKSLPTFIPLQNLRPDLPEYFATLIDRMLAIDFRLRPINALIVLKYLNQHLDQPIPLLSDANVASTLQKAPLIGRNDELRRMTRLAEQTILNQAPSFLHIRGPLGVGRSRLIEEWKWQVRLQGERFWEAGPDRAAHWPETLAEHLSGKITPKLQALLELPMLARSVSRMTLAFRDLQHWPEEAAQEISVFLKNLNETKASIFVILETQDESISPELQKYLSYMRELPHWEEMKLSDLPETSALDLVHEASVENPLDAQRARAIVRASGGRPLLILEEVRLALASGHELKSHTLLEASRGIASICALRTAELSETGKFLLALLLCSEKGLPYAELQELWPLSKGDSGDAVMELDQRHFLAPRTAENPDLTLAHPSLRDIFIQTLSPELVQEAHRTWLHFLTKKSDDRIPELLRHGWIIGEFALLRERGFKGVEALLSQSRPLEAVQWLEKLLSIAETPAELVLFNAYLAPLYFSMGKFKECLTAYDAWIRHRQEDCGGLQALKYDFYTGLTYFTAGYFSEARARLQQGLARGKPAEFREHRPYLAKAHIILGILAQKRGNFPEAKSHLADSLPLAGDDSKILGELEQSLGFLAEAELNLETALTHHRRSREHYEHAGDRHAVALALQSSAIVLKKMGQIKDALREIELASEYALQTGKILQWARAQENLGLICIDLGFYRKAKEILEKAESILTLIAKPEDRDLVQLNRAQLHALLGNFTRSEQTLSSLEASADADFLKTLSYSRGELHYIRGDFQQAEKYFEKGISAKKAEVHNLTYIESLSAQGILRCHIRTGRKLTEESRFEPWMRQWQGLAFPSIQVWYSLFALLATPIGALSPAQIENALTVVRKNETPEIRLDAYQLLAMDLSRKGLADAAALMEAAAQKEWQLLLQEVPPESRIDFEKNRRFRRS